MPRTGVATFYDSDGGGACSYDPGPGPLTAAMNEADYVGSAACGAHVLVQAGGKSITVRITNLCPAPCRAGQLDLSAEAFALLAPPVKGEIPVTWTLVSPQTTKNAAIRYKSGVHDRVGQDLRVVLVFGDEVLQVLVWQVSRSSVSSSSCSPGTPHGSAPGPYWFRGPSRVLQWI